MIAKKVVKLAVKIFTFVFLKIVCKFDFENYFNILDLCEYKFCQGSEGSIHSN